MYLCISTICLGIVHGPNSKYVKAIAPQIGWQGVPQECPKPPLDLLTTHTLTTWMGDGPRPFEGQVCPARGGHGSPGRAGRWLPNPVSPQLLTVIDQGVATGKWDWKFESSPQVWKMWEILVWVFYRIVNGYIYIYIYIHACMHAYIHTYIHTYTYIYNYMYIARERKREREQVCMGVEYISISISTSIKILWSRVCDV